MSHYGAEIRQFKADLAAAQTELEDYRNDYKILCDNEPSLVQVLAVSKNSDYVLTCLDASVTNIKELGTSDKVPGFKELFEFDQINTSSGMYANLVECSSDFTTNVEDVCKEIDKVKEEVAHKIDSLTSEIADLEWQISYLEAIDYDD